MGFLVFVLAWTLARVARTRELCIFSHSTFSKTNTFGIDTKYPTKISVSLAEN